jgi:hypothetical protein
MNESLIVSAQLYASRHGLEITERLGSGKDGTVLVAKRKIASAKVAIKAHRFEETYLRERLAYERLRKLEIISVRGFSIPQIADFDDDLRILEMTIVDRPFVLDFAATYLDRRPEFTPEIWAEWEAEKREQFEGRWPIVEQILDSFEEMGMYLVDVSPANIAFPD